LQADGNRNLFVKFRNDTTDGITVFNDLTSNAWGVSSGDNPAPIQ